MSLGMLTEMNDLRRAMAAFSEAKRLFDELAHTPVHISDGNVKQAIEEAKVLMSQAAEHHATIQLAINELADPKTAASEFDRLRKQAADHNSEMGKFVDGAKALVGAEFGAISKAIADAEAAK